MTRATLSNHHSDDSYDMFLETNGQQAPERPTDEFFQFIEIIREDMKSAFATLCDRSIETATPEEISGLVKLFEKIRNDLSDLKEAYPHQNTDLINAHLSTLNEMASRKLDPLTTVLKLDKKLQYVRSLLLEALSREEIGKLTQQRIDKALRKARPKIMGGIWSGPMTWKKALEENKEPAKLALGVLRKQVLKKKRAELEAKKPTVPSERSLPAASTPGTSGRLPKPTGTSTSTSGRIKKSK
ncbi:MAG: hypothetical protein Q8O95_02355 [bacterium]|nr:hypothetical protein [bacterium]